MNFDYIFIMTYGRSGSTLLQGALNAIPGVQIRGENAGALHGLFYSWKAAVNASTNFAEGSHKPTSSWYGATYIDPEWYGRDLAASFVRNILKAPRHVRVTGFKEIRYNLAPPDLAEEVAFIRRFFRRSAFVINTRDLQATIASSRKAGHDIEPDHIEAVDTALRGLCTQGNGDTFHVHYDDYSANPEALRPLFDCLGARFDCGIMQTVFETRHSG